MNPAKSTTSRKPQQRGRVAVRLVQEQAAPPAALHGTGTYFPLQAITLAWALLLGAYVACRTWGL